MKLPYIIFASLLCSSLAIAEPETTRESFVSASAQFGNQSYQEYDLASKLALNNIWRVDLDLSSSNSWSTEGKYTHTKLALSGALVDEPELSFTYKASSAWEIALNTIYSKQQFEQGITAAGPSISYNF